VSIEASISNLSVINQRLESGKPIRLPNQGLKIAKPSIPNIINSIGLSLEHQHRNCLEDMFYIKLSGVDFQSEYTEGILGEIAKDKILLSLLDEKSILKILHAIKSGFDIQIEIFNKLKNTPTLAELCNNTNEQIAELDLTNTHCTIIQKNLISFGDDGNVKHIIENCVVDYLSPPNLECGYFVGRIVNKREMHEATKKVLLNSKFEIINVEFRDFLVMEDGFARFELGDNIFGYFDKKTNQFSADIQHESLKIKTYNEELRMRTISETKIFIAPNVYIYHDKKTENTQFLDSEKNIIYSEHDQFQIRYHSIIKSIKKAGFFWGIDYQNNNMTSCTILYSYEGRIIGSFEKYPIYSFHSVKNNWIEITVYSLENNARKDNLRYFYNLTHHTSYKIEDGIITKADIDLRPSPELIARKAINNTRKSVDYRQKKAKSLKL
jgi:hypothetical protein